MTLGALGESHGEARAPTPGLPLVLIHGYLGGAAQWRDQIEGLAAQRRVIAVDLPGFGDASDQPSPPTIAGFADHVIDTLDRMGVARCVLLGHSMGGMIAQEVACRSPARVDRLILYGTGPMGSMPDRFEPLQVSFDRLEADGVEKTVNRIVATWFVDGDRHPGFQRLSRIGAVTSGSAARSALGAMAGWDGRANLPALDVPALILWGDRDRSYRWPQIEALWRDLPNASLAVVPGASHAVHLEKPAIFDLILKDYLAQ